MPGRRPHRGDAAGGPGRAGRAGRHRAGRPRCGLPDGGLPAEPLGALPAGAAPRVLRGWLGAAGVPDLQAVHLRAVEALVIGWRGQGAVDLPGGAGVVRASGRLLLLSAPERGGRLLAPDDLEEPTRD